MPLTLRTISLNDCPITQPIAAAFESLGGSIGRADSNTLALPDHADRIQVAYTPLFGNNKKLSAEIKSFLQPDQWVKLINRISQIPEPIVPIAPSQYAIKVTRGGFSP